MHTDRISSHDPYADSATISNVERFKTIMGNCYCGHSVAEAISLGCSYDPLAIAWSPPQCTDKELTDEFNHAGPGPDGKWAYYADPNGTLPLTEIDVAMLADTKRYFYATHEWHLVHCNYSWRKLYRSQMTGVIMDKDKLPYDHIIHCGMLEGPKYHHLVLQEIRTKVSDETRLINLQRFAKLRFGRCFLIETRSYSALKLLLSHT